jgi:hypothetical protein
MSTHLKRLKHARALIATPEQWTQDTLARDLHGNKVQVNSPLATCFCSIGAIRRAFVDSNENDLGPEFWSTVGELSCHLPVPFDRDLVFFNDAFERTHEEVLAAFDATIERLEAADPTCN